MVQTDPILAGGAADSPQEQQSRFNTNAWSDAAPSLPGQLISQLAQANVSPADPVGQWIIKTGVPALANQGQQTNGLSIAQSAANIVGDPALLSKLKALPLDQQASIYKMSAPQVGALNNQQLTQLLNTGSISQHHGLLWDVGHAATTAIRDTMTVAAAPLEGLEAGFRWGFGGNDNPLKELATLGGHYVIGHAAAAMGHPIQGSGVNDTQDFLNQITLIQALNGKSLGSGFFPSGPAHAAAVQSQEQAAAINGHALTPGRAYASTVVQPGSRPYSILSGMIDATVAIKGDPTALALGEMSDALKAGRVFAPTAEGARLSAARYLMESANDSTAVTALKNWAAGNVGPESLTDVEKLLGKAPTATYTNLESSLTRDIAEKLRNDPGSLQQLIDHPDLNLTGKDIASAIGRDSTGALSGFRNMVHAPTAMEWLNSPSGVDWAEKTAGRDFYDIWRSSNGQIPVDVAAQLGDARNADDVRSIIGAQLGTIVRGVPEGVMPYAWKRPLQDLRLFQYLPKGTIDVNDLDQAVEQMRRELLDNKVPIPFYDTLLGDVAKSRNANDFYQARKQVLTAIRDTAIDRGAPKDFADSLITKGLGSVDRTLETQMRWADELGNAPHMSGVSFGGDTVPLAGPHLSNELLNQALPTLDAREIHRNVGAWGEIWNHPVVGPMAKSATYVTDGLTKTFKVFATLRPALALRVLAESQARMATDGLDSMFKSPADYIASVFGHDYEVDKLGTSWQSQLATAKSAYQRAVGESAKWSTSVFDADTQLSKHYAMVAREDPLYLKGWENELSHLSMDGVASEVGKALQDPTYAPEGIDAAQHAGLDAVKEWGWSGAGARYRTDLANAHLWGGASDMLGLDRGAWNSYVDTVEQRVHFAAADHPELLDAVANGSPFSLTKRQVTDPEFRATLRSLQTQGIGPDQIRTRLPIVSKQTSWVRNTVDHLFGGLMDTPTKTLSRSPAFKQYYLQRFDELAPYISDGTITAEKADALAKDFGLKGVRDLLYTPSERSNIAEKLRNIVPFAEVWRNIGKSWAKLGAENPQVFRRVEQGVMAARGSGFFHQDPQTGQEVFTMAPAGMMKFLTGVPFAMTAPVKGINIFGQGLPGVGPAVQIAASALLPKGNSITDGLRQHLMPYGEPDFTSGFFESLFPGWLDKMRASGYMLHYLPGSPNLPFLTPNANDQRLVGDLAKSVFTYHMSSGQYNLSDPNTLNDLVKQSTWEAQKLYLIRSLGQFSAPSSPTVVPQVKTKDGSLMETYLLSKDWQTMEKLYGNLDQATLAFVNKYGPKMIFATEPDAQRVVFGAPTTEEASIWRSQHSDFANTYKDVYGYFAPQQGQFSYQAYLDSIKRGDIAPLSVDKWAKLAEARLGNAIYSQLRAQIGVSPNKGERDWLAQQKDNITTQYPGFNIQSLKPSRDTLDTTANELLQASNDPTVAKTPTAYAARTYIQLRDQALAEARQRTGLGSTGLAGKSMADLRAWLYENGTRIAAQYPDFANIWQDLFLNEVQPPQENQ